MQGAVPDISDVAGEQVSGLAPVGPVVIAHRPRPPGPRHPGPVPPAWVVGHTIGRVGDHQMRQHPVETALHRRPVRGIAADQAMAAEGPDIARPGDRVGRRLGNVVSVSQTVADPLKQPTDAGAFGPYPGMGRAIYRGTG